jgi:hypothetical protein
MSIHSSYVTLYTLKVSKTRAGHTYSLYQSFEKSVSGGSSETARICTVFTNS